MGGAQMAQAVLRNTTKTIARRHEATAKRAEPAFDANPNTFPDRYALRVHGDCLAPAIADGSSILIDRTKPLRQRRLGGDLSPSRARRGLRLRRDPQARGDDDAGQ